MPELPEVETVRRQLEPQVVGSLIARSWSRLERLSSPSIEAFEKGATGRRILSACRRGKQLYFPLDDGANLLVHLGMTGRLHVEPGPGGWEPASAPKHVHMVLIFEDSRRLIFTDPRTFGAVGVATRLSFLDSMGPEPLDADFDEAALVAALAKRATKIKAAILDQHLVTGLGNIYADEVCFLARVHPEQRACDVPKAKLRAIVAQMRPVLERAIEARGATLKDGGYQDVFGQAGAYLPSVYGNTGQPCPNCATPIRRGVLGPGKSARSYHFCPRCQPLRQPRAAAAKDSGQGKSL